MHSELVESLRARADGVSARRCRTARGATAGRAQAAAAPPGGGAADLNFRSLQSGARGADLVLATGVDSGILLRMVRDLRRVHSHIAALAYPVIERAAGGADRGDRPALVSPIGLVAQTGPTADLADQT